MGTQAMSTFDDTDDIYGKAIISEVAAKRESGLQLLMMDTCDTEESFALPETLRHLFLSSR